MARNKWDKAKCTILPLPFLLLGAWLLDLPFFLPAFSLPERLYLALDSSITGEGLRAARGGAREAFAVTGAGLVPLPPPGADASSYDEIASLLPDFSQTGPVLADLETGLPPLRKARIVSSAPLSEAEIRALDGAAKQSGLPLALETEARKGGFPLMSLSWRSEATADRLSFELLFAPEARDFEEISVASVGRAGSGGALWKGSGRALPADLVLRLGAGKAELSRGIRVEGTRGGTALGLGLDLEFGSGLEERPKVLVITEKKEGASFIEKLYETERLGPAEAAGRDFRAYELVVVDGIGVRRIRGQLLDRLLEAQRERYASILFVADSPDFGKKGDNPSLEAILPVSLAPRSLRDLPDIALLVLIDSSGSMFGDKLSLAKVTGLELLRNLKPSDRVGMLLFSDKRRWLYGFEESSSVVAAPELDPVPAEGGTDLAAALSEGLDRLARTPMRERHAVVVSDGVTKPADFAALAARARREGVSVSTMGLGPDLDRGLLERLAAETGGRFYMVGSASEIPSLIFEDRRDQARPPFVQKATPILNLNGDEVSRVGGMALFSADEGATVLFADKLGDPLLASREFGNRAVLLFASDLYGAYTGDFFSRAETAGVFRERLDSLFADSPLEVSILEGGRGIDFFLRSGSLSAPRLALSSPDGGWTEAGFRKTGPGTWAARLYPARKGGYTASISDRGSRLSQFAVSANSGLSGTEAGDGEAFRSREPLAARHFRERGLWLLLFFASSLGTTLLLRLKR
jgi:Mg-chelatase subunit ChlD